MFYILPDIDECVDDSLNHCEVQDSCINTNGSYTCSCNTGYTLHDNRRNCAGKNI